MLEVSDTTICMVIKKYRKPGVGVARGQEGVVEYFISGKRYESTVWNSNDSYNIGDCFLLEYSVENPQISKVLWDKGKQDCHCKE